MIDDSLRRTLLQTGFDEKEARVYLALLELGQATASQIADRAEIKRAIVYHVVKRLQTAGYAQEIQVGAVKQFAAADPQKVLQNIQAATSELKFMLPVMRALQNRGAPKPRIEFFEGVDAIVSVYRSYDAGKSIRFVTSTQRLIDFIPEEVDAWMNRFRNGMITSSGKHFVTDTPMDRAWAAEVTAFGQQVRLLPAGVSMEMDFAIVDDMLGITSFDPLFIVVIHSAGITQSAATLFDIAWQNGKDIN